MSVFIFEVTCRETRFGDSVCVVGDIHQLGQWDVERAIPLTTNADTFPLWISPAIDLLSSAEGSLGGGSRPGLTSGSSSNSGSALFNFKIIIRSADGSVRWEWCANRQVHLSALSTGTLTCVAATFGGDPSVRLSEKMKNHRSFPALRGLHQVNVKSHNGPTNGASGMGLTSIALGAGDNPRRLRDRDRDRERDREREREFGKRDLIRREEREREKGRERDKEREREREREREKESGDEECYLLGRSAHQLLGCWPDETDLEGEAIGVGLNSEAVGLGVDAQNAVDDDWQSLADSDTITLAQPEREACLQRPVFDGGLDDLAEDAELHSPRMSDPWRLQQQRGSPSNSFTFSQPAAQKSAGHQLHHHQVPDEQRVVYTFNIASADQSQAQTASSIDRAFLDKWLPDLKGSRSLREKLSSVLRMVESETNELLTHLKMSRAVQAKGVEGVEQKGRQAIAKATRSVGVALALLDWVTTGKINCTEDGQHHRPHESALLGCRVFSRIEWLTFLLAWRLKAQHAISSPPDANSPADPASHHSSFCDVFLEEGALIFLAPKIHEWVLSTDGRFTCCEPLTRIRDIAHRNDIPENLKREIKTNLQNKLHRNVGPEDLRTCRDFLARFNANPDHYSGGFLHEFRVFAQELEDFFTAPQLDELLLFLADKAAAVDATALTPAAGGGGGSACAGRELAATCRALIIAKSTHANALERISNSDNTNADCNSNSNSNINSNTMIISGPEIQVIKLCVKARRELKCLRLRQAFPPGAAAAALAASAAKEEPQDPHHHPHHTFFQDETLHGQRVRLCELKIDQYLFACLSTVANKLEAHRSQGPFAWSTRKTSPSPSPSLSASPSHNSSTHQSTLLSRSRPNFWRLINLIISVISDILSLCLSSDAVPFLLEPLLAELTTLHKSVALSAAGGGGGGGDALESCRLFQLLSLNGRIDRWIELECSVLASTLNPSLFGQLALSLGVNEEQGRIFGESLIRSSPFFILSKFTALLNEIVAVHTLKMPPLQPLSLPHNTSSHISDRSADDLISGGKSPIDGLKRSPAQMHGTGFAVHLSLLPDCAVETNSDANGGGDQASLYGDILAQAYMCLPKVQTPLFPKGPARLPILLLLDTHDGDEEIDGLEVAVNAELQRQIATNSAPPSWPPNLQIGISGFVFGKDLPALSHLAIRIRQRKLFAVKFVGMHAEWLDLVSECKHQLVAFDSRSSNLTLVSSIQDTSVCRTSLPHDSKVASHSPRDEHFPQGGETEPKDDGVVDGSKGSSPKVDGGGSSRGRQNEMRQKFVLIRNEISTETCGSKAGAAQLLRRTLCATQLSSSGGQKEGGEVCESNDLLSAPPCVALPLDSLQQALITQATKRQTIGEAEENGGGQAEYRKEEKEEEEGDGGRKVGREIDGAEISTMNAEELESFGRKGREAVDAIEVSVDIRRALLNAIDSEFYPSKSENAKSSGWGPLQIMVRSSSTFEDSATNAGAGLFESLSCCVPKPSMHLLHGKEEPLMCETSEEEVRRRTEEVCSAIKSVWKSLFSSRALRSLQSSLASTPPPAPAEVLVNGKAGWLTKMGILIQPLILGDWSFVAHTRAPFLPAHARPVAGAGCFFLPGQFASEKLAAEEMMAVELVKGHGETLASGGASLGGGAPSTIFVHRTPRRPPVPHTTLTQSHSTQSHGNPVRESTEDAVPSTNVWMARMWSYFGRKDEKLRNVFCSLSSEEVRAPFWQALGTGLHPLLKLERILAESVFDDPVIAAESSYGAPNWAGAGEALDVEGCIILDKSAKIKAIYVLQARPQIV